MRHLLPLDLAVLIAYFMLLQVVGFVAGRRQKNAADISPIAKTETIISSLADALNSVRRES